MPLRGFLHPLRIGADENPVAPLHLLELLDFPFEQVEVVMEGQENLLLDPAAPSNAERIQVLVAITEDDVSSTVTRGENNGRTLHHVAVARTVQVVNVLSERPSTEEKQVPIRREWGPNLKAVVWLQGMKSREVYGSASALIRSNPSPLH